MVQISLRKEELPLFSGSLPELVYAGQISDEPEWIFPSHRHDDLCELIYIQQGEGRFIIDNKAFTARAGDILIYNQGVLHEEKSNPADPLTTYFCGISGLRLQGLPDGHLLPSGMEPVIHAGDYRHKVESYITDIFEECHSQVLGFDVVCQNLLVSLLVFILRLSRTHAAVREPSDKDRNSIGMQIKSYIDKHYTQNISLNQIANRLYLSPHYLSHIFKKETGTSPINYMISRRIGESKKLLLTTDMTVQDIARHVGYDNTNYFTMLFKKVEGVSPSKFKEKNMP